MSRGGYESHLDFLEMHGAITREEREQTRKLEQEFRDHPERFRVVTLEELMKEIEADKESEK